ncbi:MAG: hypothetical protein R3E88_11205 [Myxococcota bacterium]
MTPRAGPLVAAAELAAIASIAAGCMSGHVESWDAVGAPAPCASAALGTVAVLPETAWREDQKDRAEREAMALRAIERALEGLGCGSLAPPGGVRALAPWSAQGDAALAAALAAEGVDTALLVRVEELGPRVAVTLSLPILWVGTTEADFRVRMLRTRDGAVWLDRRVRRTSGGPFQLRPAAWAEDELAAGLRAALAGDAPR